MGKPSVGVHWADAALHSGSPSVYDLYMGALHDTIRDLVAAGDYVVTKHAAERLRQRGILAWQAVGGLDDGILIRERPNDQPFPSIEVRESLPDGTEFKAIWSHVEVADLARLVTVHFFDR